MLAQFKKNLAPTRNSPQSGKYKVYQWLVRAQLTYDSSAVRTSFPLFLSFHIKMELQVSD